MAASKVIVYGVNDDDTQRAREFLDGLGVGYEYVDLDRDKTAEEMVKAANDGKLRTPLVVVQFGTEARKLRAPSNDELADAVRDLDTLESAA